MGSRSTILSADGAAVDAVVVSVGGSVGAVVVSVGGAVVSVGADVVVVASSESPQLAIRGLINNSRARIAIGNNLQRRFIIDIPPEQTSRSRPVTDGYPLLLSDSMFALTQNSGRALMPRGAG